MMHQGSFLWTRHLQDNRNIRDIFRLMTQFQFDFIINSQVLWGDCDTLDALAIYQLIRPENAKFVTVMP